MTVTESTTDTPASRSRPRAGRSETTTAWFFMTPGIILLLLFIVVPFALAIAFSFTNQRLVSPLPTRFVGIDNYLDEFANPLFWRSIWNNFRFAIFVVPFQTAFALTLAVLVNQRFRGRVLFRTTFFMPITVVMAAAATIWVLLFNLNGLINAFFELITFGNFSPDWLNDPTWAMWAVIIVSVWQGVGFQMVILLAALQDVPEELYEASAIDGADTWRQFLYVTVPGIRNALVFVLTVTTILSLRLYDQVVLMPRSPGGPLDSTRTTMLHMVDTGFNRQGIGKGSAIAVIFFVLVLIITLIQRRFIREEET